MSVCEGNMNGMLYFCYNRNSHVGRDNRYLLPPGLLPRLGYICTLFESVRRAMGISGLPGV